MFDSRSSKLLRTGIAISVLVLLSGCWDWNKTFKFGHPVTAVIQYFVFEEPQDEFPVDEWYNGQAGTPMPVAGSGFKTWCVRWEVKVAAGQSIHLGLEFEGDPKWREGAVGSEAGNSDEDGRVANADDNQSYRYSGLAVSTDLDPVMGLVLQVEVLPDAPTSLTVTQLDWTASQTPLPLANLVIGDPTLATLPWEPVPVELPLVISPGDAPLIIDIPDDQLAGFSYGLVQYITSDNTYSFIQETVYQTRPTPDEVSKLKDYLKLEELAK